MAVRALPSTSIIGFVILFSGCGSSPGHPNSVVVKDSAGVRIIENFVPVWALGEEWRLQAEIELEIEEPLDPVDVIGWGDGGIAVVDAMLPGVRFFDSSGNQVSSVEGKGPGPDEFLFPEEVVRYRGDSLAVFDAQANRLSVLTSDGRFSRSLRVRTEISRVFLVGSLEDGSFIFRGNPFEPKEKRWREVSSILRVRPEGGVAEETAKVPGREFFSVDFRGGRATGLTPFGPRTLLVAAGGEITAHLQYSCSFESFNSVGHLVAVVSAPCERRKITPEAKQNYTDERVSRYRREADRERARALYGSRIVPYARVAPPFRKILRDSSQHLWAEVFPLPGDSVREWWVFRGDGRWLGGVEVPMELDIASVGDEFVLGLTEDGLGRKRVLVHRLKRGNN